MMMLMIFRFGQLKDRSDKGLENYLKERFELNNETCSYFVSDIKNIVQLVDELSYNTIMRVSVFDFGGQEKYRFIQQGLIKGAKGVIFVSPLDKIDYDDYGRTAIDESLTDDFFPLIKNKLEDNITYSLYFSKLDIPLRTQNNDEIKRSYEDIKELVETTIGNLDEETNPLSAQIGSACISMFQYGIKSSFLGHVLLLYQKYKNAIKVNDPQFKIILAGRGGCGKTTYLNVLKNLRTGAKAEIMPYMTVGVNYSASRITKLDYAYFDRDNLIPYINDSGEIMHYVRINKTPNEVIKSIDFLDNKKNKIKSFDLSKADKELENLYMVLDLDLISRIASSARQRPVYPVLDSLLLRINLVSQEIKNSDFKRPGDLLTGVSSYFNFKPIEVYNYFHQQKCLYSVSGQIKSVANVIGIDESIIKEKVQNYFINLIKNSNAKNLEELFFEIIPEVTNAGGTDLIRENFISEYKRLKDNTNQDIWETKKIAYYKRAWGEIQKQKEADQRTLARRIAHTLCIPENILTKFLKNN